MTINFKVESALAELKNALKENCSFSELENAAQNLVDVLEAEQEEKLREIRLEKELEKEKVNNTLRDLKIFRETYEEAVEEAKLDKKLIIDDFEEKTKKYIAEFKKIFC